MLPLDFPCFCVLFCSQGPLREAWVFLNWTHSHSAGWEGFAGGLCLELTLTPVFILAAPSCSHSSGASLNQFLLFLLLELRVKPQIPSLKLSLLDLFTLFHMWMFCIHICNCTVRPLGACGGQKWAADSPGTGVTGSYWPPCGWWESNLEGLQVLSTVESALQHPFSI